MPWLGSEIDTRTTSKTCIDRWLDIVTEVQRDTGRIIEHLTGTNLAGGPPPNELLKLFMYYRLADYLSDALHTLRPHRYRRVWAAYRGRGQLAASTETQTPDDDGDETER